MCSLFANLYVLSTWGPHMVYMGSPYIFYIYKIKCGWLGNYRYLDMTSGCCILVITLRLSHDKRMLYFSDHTATES